MLTPIFRKSYTYTYGEDESHQEVFPHFVACCPICFEDNGSTKYIVKLKITPDVFEMSFDICK